MSATKPIPLSVLQVIPALDAGGAERTAVDVARAVVRAGGKAWIATKGGRLAAEAQGVGATIIEGPFGSKNPLTIWRNAKLLDGVIRENAITIVHARSRAPAWSAYLAARRTGVKYVATYHGIYNAKSGLKRWYNGIMARGDAVISEPQRRRMLALAAEHGLSHAQVKAILVEMLDVSSTTRVPVARYEEICEVLSGRGGTPATTGGEVPSAAHAGVESAGADSPGAPQDERSA